jgi:hypothetical protein
MLLSTTAASCKKIMLFESYCQQDPCCYGWVTRQLCLGDCVAHPQSCRSLPNLPDCGCARHLHPLSMDWTIVRSENQPKVKSENQPNGHVALVLRSTMWWLVHFFAPRLCCMVFLLSHPPSSRGKQCMRRAHHLVSVCLS